MVDELDPIAVDNAVRELYGKKPATTAKTTSTAPKLEGLNPDLLARVQEAQAAYRKQFGKDLPITSGVRTRAEQERLFNDFKAGKPNIYMPNNPANFPNKQIFHTDSVDIDSKVPEAFLNKFGIHRPKGSEDPVHTVLMPTPKTESPEQVADDFDLPKIDSMVKDVYKNPPVKEEKGVKASVGKFFGNLGASAASMADVAAGVIPAAVGMITYPIARQFQSPEEAAKTQQKVMKPLEQPFGKVFGVTESPAYKGEYTRQLTDFIGENVGKGADWIAEKTGMPKSDVESYMSLGMLAAPAVGGAAKNVGAAALKSKPVQAVVKPIIEEGKMIGEAVSAATPQVVKNAVGRTVEAVAPGYGITKPPVTSTPAAGQPIQAAPYAQAEVMQPGGSVGAAGTPNATIIQQALNSATPEFQQLYGSMPLNKLNTPVVLRHLEADSLPIPIRLTEGMATGDLVKISQEQNIRGTTEGKAIAYRVNEINKALVDNVPLIKEQTSPDVYATKTIESSEALINAYKELDTARNLEISRAYKELENANGGAFPVDGSTIVKNAESMLSKKLKTEFLPPSIKAQLERFKNGEQMTFEQFEALRTNLAGEIRKAERSGDGNAAMASSIVRQAMEDLPLIGDAAGLKPLADNARNLAKSRFDALKKDPAYRASVNDTIPADKFFDKFVIRGVNKNVDTMINTFGENSVPHQHVKAGTINWLSDKAGILDGKGNFSQANYNKGLKSLDDVRNFQAIFNPETQLQLKTLGNVANYSQFQPRGAYVNNSNTLVGYLANKAANVAEGTGNVAGLKFMGGYPIGTEARQFLQSRAQKAEVQKSLQPGAGSNIK